MRLEWKAGATSTHCGSLWTFPTRSPLLTSLGGRAQGQDLPPSGLSHPRFLRLSPSLIGRASSPPSWAQFPGRLWMAGRPPYPRTRPGFGPLAPVLGRPWPSFLARGPRGRALQGSAVPWTSGRPRPAAPLWPRPAPASAAAPPPTPI